MKIKQVKFWAIILLIFTILRKAYKYGVDNTINKINKKNAKTKKKIRKGTSNIPKRARNKLRRKYNRK
jgi:hypothetical protein